MVGFVFICFFLLAVGLAIYFSFREPPELRERLRRYDELEKEYEKRLEELRNKLRSLDGFSFDPNKYICEGFHFDRYPVGHPIKGFAIDKDNKKLCLFQLLEHAITVRVVPWSDLIEFQVVEDGGAVTHATRGKQLARAAVGGLLFGGAGAIVGASLADSAVSSRQVRLLELVLGLRDIDNPVFSVRLLDYLHRSEKDGGLSVSTAYYRSKLGEARQMAAMLSVILSESND